MKYEALLDLTVVQALYCYKRGWIYITLKGAAAWEEHDKWGLE